MGGSTNAEKEGLIRALGHMDSMGLSVAKLTTDRHPQVQKWLRDNRPDISHYYDAWHVAKGMYTLYKVAQLLFRISSSLHVTNQNGTR